MFLAFCRCPFASIFVAFDALPTCVVAVDGAALSTASLGPDVSLTDDDSTVMGSPKAAAGHGDAGAGATTAGATTTMGSVSLGTLSAGSVLSAAAAADKHQTFLAVDYAYARTAGFKTDWMFPTDHSLVGQLTDCSFPHLPCLPGTCRLSISLFLVPSLSLACAALVFVVTLDF